MPLASIVTLPSNDAAAAFFNGIGSEAVSQLSEEKMAKAVPSCTFDRRETRFLTTADFATVEPGMVASVFVRQVEARCGKRYAYSMADKASKT